MMRIFAQATSAFPFLFAFLAATQAHAQYVWGPQDLTKMRDYSIDRIQVPFGSGNIAFNHRVAFIDHVGTRTGNAPSPEHQSLDEALRGCIASGATDCNQTHWRPTGRQWDVFKLGTPETVPVTRFYIPSINSHVYVAANEMTGNETTLAVLRRFSDVYFDEGERFAVKSPLDAFFEGKLPLAQACGDEKQSGLTAMLRIYNNGFTKPNQPMSVSLAVRFNDSNHLFTTRNDPAFVTELRRIPGWEIAGRDGDNNNGRSGVWCVPSQTKTLIQSTDFAGVPGENLVGISTQAQTHELSRFALDGLTISVAQNYRAQSHTVNTFLQKTNTGGIGINSNRSNTFALTRELGGYVQYSYTEGQTTSREVFPKAPLSVDEGWSAIKVNEETGVVYAISATTGAIKMHAYDPTSNSYQWQYTLPEVYRQYRSQESELHLAGNHLVSYLHSPSAARDAFKGALVVVPLNSVGTPEVRIIDLPGPNNFPVDFAYNPKTAVGTFADAGAQTLIHLNFNDWSTRIENVPFQPYAVVVNEASGQLYATHVPQQLQMHPIPTRGALWKRPIEGGNWAQVADLGFYPVDISVINLSGVPKILVFNRGGDTGNTPGRQNLDFVDLKTGAKTPKVPDYVFGNWFFQKDLGAIAERK